MKNNLYFDADFNFLLLECEESHNNKIFIAFHTSNAANQRFEISVAGGATITQSLPSSTDVLFELTQEYWADDNDTTITAKNSDGLNETITITFPNTLPGNIAVNCIDNSSFEISRGQDDATTSGGSGYGGEINFVETIRNIGFRLLDEPTNVNVFYDTEAGEVSIKWTDPGNIATAEPVTATWNGTVVVRKAGSVPLHRWDGDLIVNSTTRNQYSLTALIDDTISANTTYFYGIFPYDEKGYYRYTKVVSVEVGELPPPDYNTWEQTSFGTRNNFSGNYVWTDGTDIYYSDSDSSKQYILDKENHVWNLKTWTGFAPPYGNAIWSDGDNVYYWDTHKFNKATGIWETITWNVEFSPFIWSDGTNIYCSNGSAYQYVLNKTNRTWEPKTWYGFQPIGADIWSDGTDIYYSFESSQYKLNKATDTWEPKTWNIDVSRFHGGDVWTDGYKIYNSGGSGDYVLDKNAGEWVAKTWYGYQGTAGKYIWSDGTNIYYSLRTDQYVLTAA